MQQDILVRGTLPIVTNHPHSDRISGVKVTVNFFSPRQTSLNVELEGESDQSLSFHKTLSFPLQNMTKVWKSIYRLRRTHKSYLQVTRVPSSTLFCRMKIPKKQHFFRQRQQKPIFGQLFKPKFMDQITRKKPSKHILLCFHVSFSSPKAIE